jgi:hypothetical protein
MTADQVNTWGLIGIYHFETASNSWFPRPCSGVVLRSMGSFSWVLTARHCLTVDHEIGGDINDYSNIRLISGAQLPILSPGQEPPLTAISPSSVIAMSASDDGDYSHDMALVTIGITLPGLVSYPKGLWVGDPASLTGRQFNAFGYGVSDPNLVCYNPPYPSDTAGVARVGGLFTVSSGISNSPGGLYNYTNWSTFDQYVDCGDSGGPDIAPYGTDDSPYDQIIGVHSTGAIPNATVQSAVVTRWVQDQMGGIFLYNDAQQMVSITNNAINFVPFGDAAAASIIYDSSTMQITADGLCLGLVGGTPVTETCDVNDPTQQWNVVWNRWITNASNNLCLTAVSPTNVTVQSCDGTSNAYWTFMTQN